MFSRLASPPACRLWKGGGLSTKEERQRGTGEGTRLDAKVVAETLQRQALVGATER